MRRPALHPKSRISHSPPPTVSRVDRQGQEPGSLQWAFLVQHIVGPQELSLSYPLSGDVAWKLKIRTPEQD